MAGSDLFGFERMQPLPKKVTPPPTVLDDEKIVEQLKALAPTAATLDTKLVAEVEELTKKKNAIEMALAPIKKQLEAARQRLLNQMLLAGTKSYKSERGVGFSRVQRLHYSMDDGNGKVKFVKAIGREDLLSVEAAKFNTLCKQLEADKRQLPASIKKSETYTLTVRGV